MTDAEAQVRALYPKHHVTVERTGGFLAKLYVTQDDGYAVPFEFAYAITETLALERLWTFALTKAHALLWKEALGG